MAHDSLWIAYAKAHYPVQTYKVCIDFYTKKSQKNKVSKIKSEAQRFFNIDIPLPKFGQDNRKISCNVKENKILLDLSTIKGVGETASEALYECRDFEGTYTELFAKKAEFNLNKGYMTNLIKIGYFEKYGNPKVMLMINELFKEYKSLNKGNIGKEYEKYEEYLDLTIDEFENLCYTVADSETKAMLRYEDPNKLFNTIAKYLTVSEPSELERLYWEVDLTGSHEKDLLQNTIVGKVIKKSIDNYSKKTKLCVLDVKTNRELWVVIENPTNCEEKDMVFIPQMKINVTKSGFVNRVAGSNMNLTKLFGKKPKEAK